MILARHCHSTKLKFISQNLISRSHLITFKCGFIFNYFSQHVLPPCGTCAPPFRGCARPEKHMKCCVVWALNHHLPAPLATDEGSQPACSLTEPRLTGDMSQCKSCPGIICRHCVWIWVLVWDPQLGFSQHNTSRAWRAAGTGPKNSFSHIVMWGCSRAAFCVKYTLYAIEEKRKFAPSALLTVLISALRWQWLPARTYRHWVFIWTESAHHLFKT